MDIFKFGVVLEFNRVVVMVNALGTLLLNKTHNEFPILLGAVYVDVDHICCFRKKLIGERERPHKREKSTFAMLKDVP